MMIIIKIRELVLKRIIQFYSPLASARTLITGQLCAAVFLTLSKGNWLLRTTKPTGVKLWRFKGGLQV